MVALAHPVAAEVLTEDTVWQGEMTVAEDVVVPAGVTLTVRAGTVVTLQAAENTKIDPEYLSHQTEITVRGALLVEGSAVSPVLFRLAEGSPASDMGDDRWAGIIVDGGRLQLHHATLQDAEVGVYVIGGRAELVGSSIEKNRYGVIAQGLDATVVCSSTTISGNDYGLFAFDGAAVSQNQSRIVDNRKKDWTATRTKKVAFARRAPEIVAPPIRRVYTSEALAGKTVWQGRIKIDGVLRVPPEATLFILPGTVVEFTRHDTNSDGIGENGLMIQGRLIAKGTPEMPIVFRSAEAKPGQGDWDAINILGSDLAQNLIEYCLIEHAYRGMHIHFSNVLVNQAVLRNNYRGVQFQESLITVANSQFYGNKSAIQARDSQVRFIDNQVFDNINGANFFRLDLVATGNTFVGNLWDGLRIREGAAMVQHNLLAGNRYGLLVADALYGDFSGNQLTDNLENGLLLRNTDHITVRGNFVQANGINGVSIREARAEISGNLISGNGERGLGLLSFSGTIANNTIVDNGLYAIGVEGADQVDAKSNWFGDSDLDREIYDKADDPALGEVLLTPRLTEPPVIAWPLARIDYDTTYTGKIEVGKMVPVTKGVALTVKPGSAIAFGPDAGLDVTGSLLAEGTSDRRILFTSKDTKEPSAWREIQLEHAEGSRIAQVDFEYATWGLHIHYTPMEIVGCRFRQNDGGMRFRSGPLTVRDSVFTGNRIALRSFRSTVRITENIIANNEIGIFVREKGDGVSVDHNHFLNNDRYDIRLGDFNREDLNAGNNWWGGPTEPGKFFDAAREPGIGKVLTDPALTEPLALTAGGLL